MASSRQIAANRRNASRSTGPRTSEGKRRSRQNAVRHGLTAQTVVTVLEDPRDYRKLEAALTADYDPQSEIERQLICRAASVLWRLRRSTAIETGLFEMSTHEHVREREPEVLAVETTPTALDVFYKILREPIPRLENLGPSIHRSASASTQTQRHVEIASTYLQVCHTNSKTLKRLGRYETALWRQLMGIVLTLRSMRLGQASYLRFR